MSNDNHQRQNDSLGTILKWATGGFIVWNLLKPEARDVVRRILSELGKALADYQRQQEELERQRRIQGFLGGLAAQLESGTTPFAQLPQASLDSLTESQATVASSAMPALEQSNRLIGQPFVADLASQSKISSIYFFVHRDGRKLSRHYFEHRIQIYTERAGLTKRCTPGYDP
jgi:hypothetical protein